MEKITLETIYKKVVDLQRDVAQIKKSLFEDPELREEFILRMKDIDFEKAMTVEDFGKRYGLNLIEFGASKPINQSTIL